MQLLVLGTAKVFRNKQRVLRDEIYRSNGLLFYVITILGLINMNWLIEANRNSNAVVINLILCSFLLISSIVAFLLNEGLLVLKEMFCVLIGDSGRYKSIPLLKIESIEWNEYSKDSFLRLSNDDRVKVIVSDLDK